MLRVQQPELRQPRRAALMRAKLTKLQMRSKLISNYGGFYKVRKDGTVWSCRLNTSPSKKGKWKKRTLATTKSGHKFVRLNKQGKSTNHYVHRLVLEAFVGPCPPGMECRHYPDQNPANNRLENLSWATPKTNQGDRKENGTTVEGENHGAVKLTESLVRKIRKKYATGKYTMYRLGIIFKVNSGTIHSVIHRKTWKHV